MIHLFGLDLTALTAAYGYWLVMLVVGMESAGIPLPGEAALLMASVYAGTTHRLDIGLVIAAAASGAIIGDNLGYWIGDGFGYRLLLRYGRFLRIDEGRLKLGQYLFLRHGGKIVFFGRFVALLRVLAAVLAGANRMSWKRFLAFNAAGALCWAGLYGMAAYGFGEAAEKFLGQLGPITLVVGLAAAVAGMVFVRRHERRLAAEAERALPGALRLPARHRA